MPILSGFLVDWVHNKFVDTVLKYNKLIVLQWPSYQSGNISDNHSTIVNAVAASCQLFYVYLSISIFRPLTLAACPIHEMIVTVQLKNHGG